MEWNEMERAIICWVIWTHITSVDSSLLRRVLSIRSQSLVTCDFGMHRPASGLWVSESVDMSKHPLFDSKVKRLRSEGTALTHQLHKLSCRRRFIHMTFIRRIEDLISASFSRIVDIVEQRRISFSSPWNHHPLLPAKSWFAKGVYQKSKQLSKISDRIPSIPFFNQISRVK